MTNKKLGVVLFIWMTIVFLVACEAKETVVPTETTPPLPKSIEIELNQPYTVHIGQIAVLDEMQLTVTELRDIRCPSEVLCAEKGFVQLSITITTQGQPPQTYLMNSDPFYKPEFGLGSTIITHNDYKIQLVEVEPYPKLPEEVIPLEAYLITFVISKDN